jgi:hypothetical protein
MQWMKTTHKRRMEMQSDGRKKRNVLSGGLAKKEVGGIAWKTLKRACPSIT